MVDRKPRPTIGVLALTLELYETLAPGLRRQREKWLRANVLKALEPQADVVFEKAVFCREDADAAVTHLETAGADAIIVVLLTYSLSQIALAALKRTRLPILIWNTQELAAVDEGFTGQAMTANHGVHGTQDLANVLVRSGVNFAYHTSHLADAGALDYVTDFIAAAAAVRRLGSARLGILGHPFPGMGDFALDTTHLVATLGCSWQPLAMEDYVTRAAAADKRKVAGLVNKYRQSYDVAAGVSAANLAATARAEIALRGLVADHRLDAITYQFIAFGQDERAETVPFVAASRLLADGVGFGGEGDLIAAAGSALLNWLCPPASFAEMFTIDFAGNSVFFSHMGEANAAMARTDRKVRLVARGKPITRTRRGQLVLATNFQPGPASLMALTLVEGNRWRLICSRGAIADFGPLDSLEVPHFKFAPAGDVRDFLTSYATAGGPHHLAVCFGDARRRVRLAADMLAADYREV